MENLQFPIDHHISLSTPRNDFAPALLQVIEQNKHELSTWITWVAGIQSLNDVKKLLWEQQLFNKGGQAFTLYILDQNLIVGSVAFTRINKRDRIGELGYWLSQSAQGKGLVTHCCHKIIEYGFQSLALNRVEIRVPSANKKSLAVPKRLGFQWEGKLREALFINDQFHDLEVFGLVKKDHINFSNNPL